MQHVTVESRMTLQVCSLETQKGEAAVHHGGQASEKDQPCQQWGVPGKLTSHACSHC